MKKIIFLLLACLFVLSLPVYADWCQFEKNEKHNAVECVVPINPPLCIQWRYPLSGGEQHAAVPLVDSNGKVYINTASSVYRFDAVTGAVEWMQYYNGGDSCGMLYNNMFIYNYANGFRALDTATGNLVWQQDVSGMTGSFSGGSLYANDPIASLHNGKIYIGNSTGQVAVVDANTGNTLQIMNVASDTILAPPAIDDDDTLYVGSFDGYFYSVNSDTGAVNWKTYFGGGLNGGASIDTNCVCLPDLASLYGVNKSDGSIQWSVLTGSFCNGTGSVVNGQYYYGSDDRYMYSVNTGTGDITWKIYCEDNMADMSPIIICSQLFINGCIDKMTLINTDQGSKDWVCHSTSSNFTTPSYWNQHIFFTSDDQYIYSIGPCQSACPCACDARPTATFEAANPGIVTETPTISQTYTPTPTITNTFAAGPSSTITPILTITVSSTFTLTITSTMTCTPTSTYTCTLTQTPTLLPTLTNTPLPSPTVTFTQAPCNGINPPSFTVQMVLDSSNNVTFNITTSAPLQSPPLVTIYTHGTIDESKVKALCSGSGDALSFTASPVSGNLLEYQVFYPKSIGSCDIDKVVVQGTDICGVPGASDGSFEKQVITNQDTKIFSNVIDPDHNDRCTIMYNVYKSSDNVVVNVYDRNGVLIKNLVNSSQPAGQYEVTWDGTNSDSSKVSSGVYLAVIKTSDYTDKCKIAVTR